MSNWADDTPGCSGRAQVCFAMGLAVSVVIMLWMAGDWLEAEALRAKEEREASHLRNDAPSSTPVTPEAPSAQCVSAGEAFGGAGVLVPDPLAVWWFDDGGSPIVGSQFAETGDTLVGGEASLLLIGRAGVTILGSDGSRSVCAPYMGFHRGRARSWLCGMDADGSPLDRSSPYEGALAVLGSRGLELWAVGSGRVDEVTGRLADGVSPPRGPVAIGLAGSVALAAASGCAVRARLGDALTDAPPVMTGEPILDMDWLPVEPGKPWALADLVLLTEAEISRAPRATTPQPAVWAQGSAHGGVYDRLVAGYRHGRAGGLCRGADGWHWLAVDGAVPPEEALWPRDGEPDPVRLADGRIVGIEIPQPGGPPRLRTLVAPAEEDAP